MSKNKNNKTSTFWISTIIAFLLSIFLTMASYLGGIYYGVFNKDIIIDSMNDGTFYNDIIDYTVNKASSLAIPMGLPETVFEDVFTFDETYNEAKAYITTNLAGNDYTPDTSNAVSRLVININKYLESQGYTITDEQENNIVTFAKTVAEEYSNNLTIPYFKYFVNVRNLFGKLAIVGLPILAVFSAFAIFLLFRLHKWAHRAMRYLAYSTIATALMTAILPALLLIGGIYKRISITPEYFYKFIVSYISRSLYTFMYFAALLAAISVILIVIISFRRKALTQSHHRNSHSLNE